MLTSILEKCRDKGHQAPALFAMSSIFVSVVQMLAGVAVVHFVRPADMGVWTAATLMIPYSFLLLGGVQNGLSRDLPYHLGAQREAQARRLASTSLFYTGLCSALVILTGI